MYNIVHALLWLVSLLPLRLLYIVSDLAYPILHYVVKYRLKVVRRNLAEAFPEKSEKERRTIENRFYHYLCDLFVEFVKQTSWSKKKAMKHMTFSGLDYVRSQYDDGRQFLILYLAHFGCWEWIASIKYWIEEAHITQVYHRLANPVADRLFLEWRQSYGGESIKMKNTLRRMVSMRREFGKVIIGLLSDQQPKWNAIHHYTQFLNHESAVFIGAEQMAKKFNAFAAYGRMTRVKRGYYHCEIIPLANNPRDYTDYELTDLYFRTLEADIQANPHLWLWSHKRWSRTKEEWLRRQGLSEQ